MTNLRSLDLNLLTVFEAVFETGSITRAADRLSLSQSATSHALGRLRDACQDELFVRLGQGIAPTAVAQRIFPEIKRSLNGLRRSLAEAVNFVPATSTRRFEIAFPHPVGPFWALGIRGAATEQAPNLVLRFDTRTLPFSQQERLRSGELDVAVDWLPPADERIVTRKLFDEHLVLVARRDHPRVQPGVAAAALQGEEYVRTHTRPGPVPESLARLTEAMERMHVETRLVVSEFLEIPYLVAQTDLLGFIPRTMTRRAMRDFGLQVIDVPLAALKVPVFLVWHETRRADEGHRWLRDLVAATVIEDVEG